MIVLKDVRFIELKALLNYMYRGEVNISQDYLSQLIKTAENLQIRGLADSGTIRKKSESDKDDESLGSPMFKKHRKNRRKSGQSQSGSSGSVEPEPEQEDSDFDENSLDKLSSPVELENSGISDEPLNLELSSEKKAESSYNQSPNCQNFNNLETISVTSSSCENIDYNDSAKLGFLNKTLDISKVDPVKEEPHYNRSSPDLPELSPLQPASTSDPADVTSSNDHLPAGPSLTHSTESKFKNYFRYTL